MLRLIAWRLALAVPVIVLVSIVAFILLRLAPGDPAQLQAGVDAGPEVVQQIRKELALDQPLPVQYVSWVERALRGDLGQSYTAKLPVTRLIGDRLPVTLQIALLALILIVVSGVPLGILSALHKDGPADQA